MLTWCTRWSRWHCTSWSASSSQPSSYKNPYPLTQGYPKARRPERGLLALFVRSSYCCMRRSQRPCRVCTSLLLTAGAPIILAALQRDRTCSKPHFVFCCMSFELSCCYYSLRRWGGGSTGVIQEPRHRPLLLVSYRTARIREFPPPPTGRGTNTRSL